MNSGFKKVNFFHFAKKNNSLFTLFYFFDHYSIAVIRIDLSLLLGRFL